LREFKIVVTGPRGAGKTTFIENISETAVVSSEQNAGGNGQGKSGATVEMDFGRISISDDTMIYLFGTQGMERFDFMWKAISEGMLGFVLMVDSSRPETLQDARCILEYFQSRAAVPCVVGLTRVSEADFPEVSAAVRERLGIDEATPLMPCDATLKDQVKEVLLGLLYHVLQDVES